jgi:hypothetical protein
MVEKCFHRHCEEKHLEAEEQDHIDQYRGAHLDRFGPARGSVNLAD